MKNNSILHTAKQVYRCLTPAYKQAFLFNALPHIMAIFHLTGSRL